MEFCRMSACFKNVIHEESIECVLYMYGYKKKRKTLIMIYDPHLDHLEYTFCSKRLMCLRRIFQESCVID